MEKQTPSRLLASCVVALALLAGAPVAAVAGSARGGSAPIVVATDTISPPFESQKNGKVVGFDIDMIKAIAKAENLDIRIKVMPWSGIIPSLQTGAVDAAVSGITIKKDRMKRINFTNAYYKSGLSILVRKDSDIKNYADLKGHVVAVKKATSSVDYLEQHGFDLASVRQLQTASAVYQALVSGGADAVIYDNPINVAFASRHKGVKVVGGLLTGEYYGIAVNKKKTALLAKLNAGLAKIKKSGVYHQLFDKWFNGDTSGAVPTVKTPAAVAVTD